MCSTTNRSSRGARWIVVVALFLASIPAGSDGVPEAQAMVDRLRSGSLDEQVAAARWLGLNRIPEAREPLFQAALRGSDPELRRVCSLMLQLLANPDLVVYRDPADVHAALGDPEPSVRLLGWRNVMYHGLTDALSRADEALDDPDPAVRSAVLEVLAALDRGDAHREWVRRSLRDPEAAVREAALLYLAPRADAEILGDLVGRLGDPAARARELAARAIEQGRLVRPAAERIRMGLREERSAPQLLGWLAALDRWRRTLGEEVSTWSGELWPLLGHDEEAIRLRAAALLAPSGERDVIRLLRRLSRSEIPERRARAVQAIARSGASVPVDDLAVLLEDPDAEVRRAAFDLVPSVPPSGALLLLRPLLDDPSDDDVLVGRAVQALAWIGDERDADAILSLGRSTGSSFVRVSALMGLGPMERRLGTRRCLPWVRELLQDPQTEASVVAAATAPLKELGDESFLPLLARRLADLEDPVPPRQDLEEAISVLLGRKLHGPTFLGRTLE